MHLSELQRRALDAAEAGQPMTSDDVAGESLDALRYGLSFTTLSDDSRIVSSTEPLTWYDPTDDPAPDNLVSELLDLAQQNDEPAFRALAACSMPPDEITDCWLGTRSRLGFTTT